MPERRLIKQHIENKSMYFVLKPTLDGEGFNKYGRRYDEKGIATYCHQQFLHAISGRSFELVFEPPTLEEHIRALINSRILSHRQHPFRPAQPQTPQPVQA